MAHVHTRLLRCLLLVVCMTVIVWAGWAQGAVLTPDPDFGAQTPGSTIGSPWYPASNGHSATATAQSPFTNVFANNSIGANIPTGLPYFVGRFANATPPATPILASDTGLVYFNVDFRNNSANPGDYALVITRDDAAAYRTAALYVTGSALYAEGSGGAGTPVLSLASNTWYNAQLTLDLTNNAYSGTVTQYGGASVVIPSRPFVFDQDINCIYTDGGNVINSLAAPNHDIDNFALSDTPLWRNPKIVNIDLNGFRPGDVMGPTYLGSGAAGGGSIFNGIPADSTGGDDNLTVSATGLLDSFGNPTGVGFTVSPVGGDVAGAGTPTTDPTSSAALYGDYVFDHSAGNNSDSPFTITFDDPTTSADLYFYTTGNAATITVDGGTLGTFTPNSIFNNVNTLFYPDVPVVNGVITGHFGNGMTAVFEGLTVVSYVPEPGSCLLLLLGGLGLLCRFRRRKTGIERAGA